MQGGHFAGRVHACACDRVCVPLAAIARLYFTLISPPPPGRAFFCSAGWGRGNCRVSPRFHNIINVWIPTVLYCTLLYKSMEKKLHLSTRLLINLPYGYCPNTLKHAPLKEKLQHTDRMYKFNFRHTTSRDKIDWESSVGTRNTIEWFF